MRMNEQRIAGYIRIVTSAPAGDRSDPLSDIGAYEPAINAMKRRAEEAEDMPWLRIALKDMLMAGGDRLTAFEGRGYPYGEDELRRLLTYTYGTIWQEDPLRDDTPRPSILYLSMSDEEWDQEKKYQTELLEPNDQNDVFDDN